MLAALCLTGSILTAGVSGADPDDPTTGPDPQSCVDVNDPNCPMFNDEHEHDRGDPDHNGHEYPR